MAGLFSRLRGGAASADAPVPPASGPRHVVEVGHGWGEIEVAGEYFRRADVERFFTTIGRQAGGVTTTTAVLEPEPGNRYDASAVKVIVDGHHLGYVPADLSPVVTAELRRLPGNQVGSIPARVWGRPRDGEWKARVTLGHSLEPEPESDYGQADRDREKRAAEDLRRREAGLIKGDFWTIYKPEVTELKRQDRLDEALMRLYQMVSASERVALAADDAPDPWPTDQICMILTKQKLPQDQLRHLNRYVDACKGREVPDKIKARLAKARAMQA